ncbi:MAG: hypothetical protein KatS3mg076_1227 [Candidatus Binatia bacterium]|nr:MAG: hypothetical protein KatS3mg076_1227 [Candidatus Binatia bacterium]
MYVRKAWAVFFLPLALLACEKHGDGALGVARGFLDSHYVRMDLPAARTLCTGLAERKVAEEIELTRGHPIDESTRVPRVRYRLLETREHGADRVSFVFLGSVEVPEGGSFTRRWLVTARRMPEGWRVSNYQEFE